MIELTPKYVPFLKGESYSDILWKLIPRYIYPNKPNPRWGNEFGHLYSIIGEADNSTSINFPQMVEMYANYGYLGVVVGMFIIGIVYRVICKLINGIDSGEWMTIMASLIYSTLFNIDSNLLLVFGSLLYRILLLYLIGTLIRETKKA